MDGQQAALFVNKERTYLRNIIKDFRSEHGDFRPVEGMLTVAQHINHVALTIAWFREGAFGSGFDMDFEKIEKTNHEPVSLEAALTRLDEEYDGYATFLADKTQSELLAPMADNPIFGAIPRISAIFAQSDHTAHHRGALSVYLRLLGITPMMIYAE